MKCPSTELHVQQGYVRWGLSPCRSRLAGLHPAFPSRAVIQHLLIQCWWGLEQAQLPWIAKFDCILFQFKSKLVTNQWGGIMGWPTIRQTLFTHFEKALFLKSPSELFPFLCEMWNWVFRTPPWPAGGLTAHLQQQALALRWNACFPVLSLGFLLLVLLYYFCRIFPFCEESWNLLRKKWKWIKEWMNK